MSKAKSREKGAEAHVEETIVNDGDEGGPLPISKLEVFFSLLPLRYLLAVLHMS